MRKHALSLSTVAKRKAPKHEKIRIRSSVHPDGRFYDLRNLGDLSAAEFRMTRRRGKRAQKILSTEPVSGANARLLLSMTDEAVTVLLPTLEREVLHELDPFQKAQIMDVWSKITREESCPNR